MNGSDSVEWNVFQFGRVIRAGTHRGRPAMTSSDRPLAVRAINAIGARFGGGPSLDPTKLMQAAEKKTGLDDWSGGRADGWDFLDGLTRLCHELDTTSSLHTIGRVAARTRLLRILEARLRLHEHRRANPQVADEVIDRPVFVLGLPRTGTTVLYGLLAADPIMRSPVSWEVSHAFPPPTGPGTPDDKRVKATEREFQQFFQLAPEVPAIHPLGAMLPQECLALHSLEFRSYEFPSAFEVPAYTEWLMGADVTTAYATEKRFLQHLQSGYGAGQHWILKTPAHLFWLDTLLEVFPDAKVVHTHRDPSRVLASVSSLMFHMRAAMSDDVDPHVVGRRELDLWTEGLQQTLKIRDQLPADRVVDVQFADTVANPVDTVRHVYDAFDLGFTDETERRVRRYLDDNPRTKHGSHRYTLEEFGIHPDEARERFADYCDRFGIEQGSDRDR